VRTRWGSKGRVNLVGTLWLEGEGERLEYSLLEGSCRSAQVIGYLDALASEAERAGEEVVVVLDNAPFHTAGAVREREEGWEEMGLSLYRLPAYCPHLNLIEGVWRRVKGFLMPRRFYDSVGELKEAVLDALRLLGATEVHIQLGDT
jgi:putative transposase